MKRVSELGAHRAVGGMAMIGLLGLGAFIANCAEAGSNEEGAPPVDASVGEDAGVGATPIGEVRDASVDAEAHPCEVSEEGCGEPEWVQVDAGQVSGIGLSSIWGSGPNDVWAVGAKGSIIHWDGATWTSTRIDTNYSLQSVYGTGPNDIWAVSTASQIYRSTGFSNGTTTFEKQTAIAENANAPQSIAVLYAVWAAGPGDVWVTGNRQPTYWRTTPGDGGVAWKAGSDLGNASGAINGIWGTSPNDVWMVGYKGTGNMSFATHTNGVSATDGGLPKWTEFDTATFAILHSVWGTGPNDVWAVGNVGTIRHYTGGTTWEIVASPTTQSLRGVWAAAANDVWAVGENGTIVHYDGAEWRPSTVDLPKGDKRHLYAVWGSGPSDVWAVGDGVVMHYSGPKSVTQGGSK